jgi:hypothetical protein
MERAAQEVNVGTPCGEDTAERGESRSLVGLDEFEASLCIDRAD